MSPCSGIALSLEQEVLAPARAWMNLKTGCNVKESRQRQNVVWPHFYEMPKGGKCIEAGSRLEVARGWGRGWELIPT